MSNAIYPTLPGLMYPVGRVPMFKTQVDVTASGREYRTAFMLYPKVKITLKYEFLRDTATATEMRTLAGFFNARRGSFDSFLFQDPDDNTVTAMQFGTGDGTTKPFQLVRSLGGFAEPIYDINGAASIYVNGTLKTLTTDYTISSTGLVTFVTAPAAAAVITWTGSYYWRCRFLADQMDLEKFMNTLWQLGKVEFTTVPP